jgi:glycosyltransferase involved in cell wall biosynthesis
VRLGIDISPLCLNDHRVRGIGRYTENLLTHLLLRQPMHEYTFFGNGLKVSAGSGPESLKQIQQVRSRGGPIINFLANQLLMPLAASRERLDVVHFPTHLGAPVIGSERTVVTVLDVIQHLYPSQYLKLIRSRLYMACAKVAARRAAAVITISEASKRDIVRVYGIDPKKVTVTPLGVDPVFRVYDPRHVDTVVRRKYGIDSRFILYVGGFDFRKNLRALISAFARIRRGHGPIKLVLVGKIPNGRDPVFAQVLQTIEIMDLAQDVILADFVPNDDLSLLYNGAAAFVFPSLYEGFGLPVLEAMACGTPVVAYNRSSVPEVVGDAGVLVDELDVDTLADAVSAVLSNPELATSKREQGLARSRDFTWGRTAAGTMEVYAEYARNSGRLTPIETGSPAGSTTLHIR